MRGSHTLCLRIFAAVLAVACGNGAFVENPGLSLSAARAAEAPGTANPQRDQGADQTAPAIRVYECEFGYNATRRHPGDSARPMALDDSHYVSYTWIEVYLPQQGVAYRLDKKVFLRADESRYKGTPPPPGLMTSMRADLRLFVPEEKPTRCKLLPELTLTAEAREEIRAGAAKAAEGPSPLEIRVEMQHPIVAETRVPLTVKIKNVSDRPVDLPWSKFINQFVSTVSTAQDSTVLTVRHVGLALGHGKYPGGNLKPGEEMTVEVWHIFPDAGGAGRHSLKCVLETSRKATPWWSFWEGRVESKPISVEAKPRGGAQGDPAQDQGGNPRIQQHAAVALGESNRLEFKATEGNIREVLKAIKETPPEQSGSKPLQRLNPNADPSGAEKPPNPETAQVKPRLDLATKALELEKQGQFRAALDLLQQLGDSDFIEPAHVEITGEREDGRFIGEWAPPRPVGNRRLAMMRCNLQLGNPREAVALAWQVLDAETADASPAFACIAQHPDLQGGFDQMETRLRDLLRKNPKHRGAGQCLDYVRVERDLADGKFPPLVARIRSGACDRSSERGPGAELKEYVALALARRSKEALPDLVKALAEYDQSTWIVYCLGRSGDQRAIEPLFNYLLSVKNYYARHETLLALSHFSDKAASYAIARLDSAEPVIRESAAELLSGCSGEALQKADPGLKHILQALREPRNQGKDGPINIPTFLLRAIAATRNHDYLDDVRRIKKEADGFGAAGDGQYVYTLAYLGDTSVVPDLIAGLDGKYSHFARPALEAATGKSFRTQKEWQEWWSRAPSTQAGRQQERHPTSYLEKLVTAVKYRHEPGAVSPESTAEDAREVERIFETNKAAILSPIEPYLRSFSGKEYPKVDVAVFGTRLGPKPGQLEEIIFRISVWGSLAEAERRRPGLHSSVDRWSATVCWDRQARRVIRSGMDWSCTLQAIPADAFAKAKGIAIRHDNLYAAQDIERAAWVPACFVEKMMDLPEKDRKKQVPAEYQTIRERTGHNLVQLEYLLLNQRATKSLSAVPYHKLFVDLQLGRVIAVYKSTVNMGKVYEKAEGNVPAAPPVRYNAARELNDEKRTLF